MEHADTKMLVRTHATSLELTPLRNVVPDRRVDDAITRREKRALYLNEGLEASLRPESAKFFFGTTPIAR